MNTKGYFCFERAISLNERNIRKFHELLSKYFDLFLYNADTNKQSNLRFYSIEALINGTNSWNGKIKVLRITAMTKDESDIFVGKIECPNVFHFFAESFESCQFNYKFLDEERAGNFLEEIKIFTGAVARKYFPFHLLSPYWLWWVFSLGICLREVYIGEPRFGMFIEEIGRLKGFFLVVGILVALSAIEYLIRIVVYLQFPMVKFLWGDELEKHNKKQRLKEKVIWVLIVGVIIAVFSPILSEMLAERLNYLFFH